MSGYPSLNAAQLGHRRSDGRVRLRHAFPLLFLGIAFLLVGAVLLQNGLHVRSVLPIWLLALSVGAVALGGGITAALAGDFGAPAPATLPRARPVRDRESAPPARRSALTGDVSARSLDLGARASTPMPVAEAPSPPPTREPPSVARVPSTLTIPGRAPPAVAESKAELVRPPPPDRALDAALSDLERMFREMGPKRSPAVSSPPTTPPWVESPSPVEAPAPVRRAMPEEPSPRGDRVRLAAAEAAPPPAGLPTGVVDEFARLLSEFYPDIKPGSRDPGSRLSSAKQGLLGCPGCGRGLFDQSGRTRCVRCTRPMCDDCGEQAATAKRALLCRSCLATYGVRSPGG
ncbi:MAG: hypothetical protein L3K23_06920 [Thermoplasmata archaeon]|nr:hypothetical protein [Thermoplasmata archaeon]